MIPFLVTVDTEGDNLWQRPARVTTRNALFLPRFQALCQAYGMIPTYLTNYEMARDPAFVAQARDWLRAGQAEIGMHLHAWDTPPGRPEDEGAQAYLIEYSEEAMRAKVATMTELLEATFQVKMVSHRAGRWAVDDRYLGILREHGYRVDCSVTPHVSWEEHRGRTRGGSDYREAPEAPHDRCGLLEVPVSIRLRPPALDLGLRPRRWPWRGLARRCGMLPRAVWLSPALSRESDDGWLLERLSTATHAELALHSCELMPGGSPYFPDVPAVERLYRRLEALFRAAAGRFVGCPLGSL